jgi:hypothetical protein
LVRRRDRRRLDRRAWACGAEATRKKKGLKESGNCVLYPSLVLGRHHVAGSDRPVEHASLTSGFIAFSSEVEGRSRDCAGVELNLFSFSYSATITGLGMSFSLFLLWG